LGVAYVLAFICFKYVDKKKDTKLYRILIIAIGLAAWLLSFYNTYKG
jgi:hypothetical protein